MKQSNFTPKVQNKQMNFNPSLAQNFASPLPAHPRNHGQRYFDTEYKKFCDKMPAPSNSATQLQGHLRAPAGRPPKAMEINGTKCISNLVGEIYNKNNDA